MKNIISIFCLLLFAVSGFAQEVTDKVDIEWGPEIKRKRFQFRDIILDDETGYYCYAVERSDIILMHFNKEMELVKETEIDMEYMKKDRTFQFFVEMSGEIYLFSSFHNRKLDQTFFFKEKVNKSTLEPSGELEKLAEITQEKRFRNAYFSYERSADEKRVIVRYDLPYEKDAAEKFGLISFDSNMEIDWQKEFELPYKEDLFSIDMMRVDNQGNAYISGRKYEEKPEAKELRKEGKQTYKFHVLSYTNKGEKKDEFIINNDDFFITDLSFRVNKKGNLIVAGFYSEKGNFTAKGTYFLSINGQTKETMTSSFKEFGFDFITEGLSDREMKKVKKRQEKKGTDPELYKFDLDRLVLREDGGAVLVAEQYYVRVVTTTSTDANGRMTTRTTYYYYYNDIIVVNINPNGQIEWQTKIPKRQVSTNDGGYKSSYSLSVAGDKMYFIFNDNAKNVYEASEDGRVWNCTFGKNAMVALVTLTSDGKFTHEALMYRDKDRLTTVPKLCEQVDKRETVVYGISRRAIRFAKVKFK